ncbi:transmembrane protein with metallophosphoesterase domain [Aplysia californica]|uniref:Transmembrane protein with metallophosphoesterase domain n=1 Tax=Aplysia californica TaxID=6500 RepID=A0ABM0JWB3_APLCA|nr:transmembrane protein with metallophosphoesterase domain [Aplysia californica]
MALLSVRNVLTGVSIVIAVLVAQIIVVKSCSHQTRAVVFRAQYILLMQLGMLAFSFILWRNFRDFPVHFSKFSCEVQSQSLTTRQKQRSSASPGDDPGASTESLFCRRNLHTSSDEHYTFSSSQNGSRSNVHNIWRLSLILYLSLCHLSYFSNLFLIDKNPHWFGMLTYSCFGSFIQLNTGLLLFKTLSLIVKVWQNYVLKISSGGSHSSLLSVSVSGIHQKRIIGLLSLIYMILASTLGLYTASQPPGVESVKIPVKDLPNNLYGLSIVQLSDIHLGPTVGLSKLQMIVDIVNKERPDVIVLTGDLVDGKAETLRGATQPLKSLTSKYGKYFVTGNHEYYTGDVDNWFSLLRSVGFTVLHNSNVRIPAELSENEDGQICLAGTDDLQADKIQYGEHRFDLAQALLSCSTALPVILLAHQPKAARLAVDSKYRVDVVLSGHTHGGQLFPMMAGAYLLNPFYAGLYSVGDNRHVYVSRGTQYWGIPMRIGTRMEITKITLVPTDD